jgi:glycosyltransferase involved in cell wall biosynthesis
MMLNAVMCVWNEEDIIASTVKHAFAQGCSNVFIVDNGSTDKTVELAINAGAILADSFESKYFDEMQKIAHCNTVVKKYNEHSNEDYIWWLYIDGHEFPNINCDLLLIDFLQSLDSSVRAVQGYILDHIPTHPPYYVSNFHPIDYMPLATKTNNSKIPLLRYDKNKKHLYSAGGAHTFDTCGELIPVAKNVLNIHHFTYRRPDFFLSRLKQLLAKNPDGTSRVDIMDDNAKSMSHAIDAQSHFHYRYNNAKSLYRQNHLKQLMLQDLSYNYKRIVRWYDLDKVEVSDNSLIGIALHYFFLEQYDIALCKFNDLLQITNDTTLQLLITIKMALCLFVTDKAEALSLLKQILKCQDNEIRDDVKKQMTRIIENECSNSDNNSVFNYSIQQYHGKFEKQYFV